MILRHFNRRLVKSLPLLDLSWQDPSSMASKLRSLRRIVFTSLKRTFFERVLSETHFGDGNSIQRSKWPSVILDRSGSTPNVYIFLHSSLMFQSSMGSSRLDTDLRHNHHLFLSFGQLHSQLHRSIPASKLRNSERAFYAFLAGEHSDDYGGPYRDALNSACQELMSPTSPLFFKVGCGCVFLVHTYVKKQT